MTHRSPDAEQTHDVRSYTCLAGVKIRAELLDELL